LPRSASAMTMAGRRPAEPTARRGPDESERADICGLRPLGALSEVELDPLVLLEAAKSACLDGREAGEHVSAAESIAPSATGPWTGRPRATTDQKGSLSCSSFRSLPADNEGCRLPAREATEFLQRQLPATGPLPSISAMSAASSTVASISALRIDTLSTLNP